MPIGVIFHQNEGAPFLNWFNEIWHAYRTHLRNYSCQVWCWSVTGLGSVEQLGFCFCSRKTACFCHYIWHVSKTSGSEESILCEHSLPLYVRDVVFTRCYVRYSRIAEVSEDEWRLFGRSTVSNDDRQIPSDMAFIGSRSQQYKTICRAVSITQITLRLH